MVVAEEITQVQMERLSRKGQKVAELLCDNSKLPKVLKQDTIQQIREKILNSKACSRLSSSKLKSLAWYLKSPIKSYKVITKLYESVPTDAKCPVCGMFVYKYPKWASEIIVNKKEYFFDGVKDMMKFYFFDVDFPYDRAKISSIRVSDFYTLESIDAKNAWYVIGSNVYGPMGRELIPFKDINSAKDFSKDHNGKKIYKM